MLREVTLQAEPPAPGEVVGTFTTSDMISRATTNSAGYYSLKVPDIGALRADADANGLIDFVVMPSSQTAGLMPYSFTRRIVPDGAGGWALVKPDTPPATQSLAASQVVTEPEVQQSSSSDSTSGADSAYAPTESSTDTADYSVDTSAYPTAAAAPCGRRLVKTWTNRNGIVGQWFSTKTSGISGQFTYSQGATSSLGVAWSLSGKYGDWKSNGTNSRDSSASLTYGQKNGDGGWLFRTQFTVKKYHYWCNQGVTHYETKTTAWEGGNPGAQSATVGSNVTKCVPQQAGDHFTKDDTHAITWSNGLSMSKILGIDLSARTGYATSAKITANYSSAGRLCGAGGFPVDTPYVLAAKPS